MSESKPVIMPDGKELGLDFLLSRSNGSPENFSDYQAWALRAQVLTNRGDASVPYPGAMRYIINIDDKSYIIIARRRKNNTFEYEGFLEMTH